MNFELWGRSRKGATLNSELWSRSCGPLNAKLEKEITIFSMSNQCNAQLTNIKEMVRHNLRRSSDLKTKGG